jgi:DNA-binding transcriptional LysR family regulator
VRDSKLATLEWFVVVATEQSFTRAARKLGVTPSAVSQAVRQLEQQVGAPLFARTTRSVRLTEAGRRLAERAIPAVRAATLALEELPVHGKGAVGVLRLNVPRISVASVVLPALPRFLADNPDASVDLEIDDRLVDIVASGFDAGVRLRESLSDGMVATRLTPPFRFVIVGAPSYLERRGRPETLADLASHECIVLRFQGNGVAYHWELEVAGKEVSLPVRGRLSVTGIAFAMEAARQGLGLAYVDEPSAAQAIAAGQLEVVLAEAAAKVPGLFLYCPKATWREAKIQAFLRACRQVKPAGSTGRRKT